MAARKTTSRAKSAPKRKTKAAAPRTARKPAKKKLGAKKRTTKARASSSTS